MICQSNVCCKQAQPKLQFLFHFVIVMEIFVFLATPKNEKLHIVKEHLIPKAIRKWS